MIVPYPKVNKDGKEVIYWTHSCFFDQERVKSHAEGLIRRENICSNLGYGAFAITAFLTRNLKFPPQIPKVGGVLGVAFLSGFIVNTISTSILIKSSGKSEFKEFVKNTPIPYWDNPRNVVNLDRVDFHLHDDYNNEICLLSHSLSPERAKEMFPIGVDGVLPPEPVKPGHHH